MKIRIVRQDWLEEPFALEYWYTPGFPSGKPFWSEIRRFTSEPYAQRAFEALKKGAAVVSEGDAPDDAICE